MSETVVLYSSTIALGVFIFCAIREQYKKKQLKKDIYNSKDPYYAFGQEHNKE